MTHQAVLVTGGHARGDGGGLGCGGIVTVPYQTLKKSKIDYKEQGCNSI